MKSENPPPKSSDHGEDSAMESNLRNVYQIAAEAYQPAEFRSNVKLWGAGLLAAGLWITVGSIAWNQLRTNIEYAKKLTDLTPELVDGQIGLVHQAKVEQIEKSVVIVDSTADRLYTFFAPIITAVTGYFFVSAGSPPRTRPPANRNSSS